MSCINNSHLVIILFSLLCGCCAGSLTRIEWVSESSTAFYNVSEPVFLTDNNAEMHQLQIEMNISSSGPEENLTVAVRVELMPEWIYWSASAYLLFISVVGLFMNIVVIVVILNDSQKMTPLNWMLLNLACSDGTIAGFGTPISAAAALKLTWPFSHELCVAYAMIMSTAGIGSITTLTVLAIWRCQHVVWRPSNGNSNFTGRLDRRHGALLLTFIWTYTLVVTCPPLFGWGRYDREAAHISCSVNWESKMDNNRSYILYMFVMGLFIPLLAIFISYISILIFIHKTSEMRRKLRTTLQTTTNNAQQIQQTSSTNSSDAVEKRVTLMVTVMIGAFLAAWTPYSILALVETFIGDDDNVTNDSMTGSDEPADGFHYYVGSISPAVATVPSLFAKTSAVLNPLIYGLLNTQFRSAWKTFSFRFLGRRKPLNQRNQMAVGVGRKRRRDYLTTLLAYPGSEPANVHLSTKEMVSSQPISAAVASNVDFPPAPNNSFITVNDE